MARHTLASTSTPNSDYNYDVFINHRGPDVKKTLACHIYSRLVSRGFRVFLDSHELQEGENLRCQIEGAIATASVHIAIFSPTYAESHWCLDELVQMLETSAHNILPVFYHVKPAELRWAGGQEGWYARLIRRILPLSTRGKDGKDGRYAKALCNLKMKRTYDDQTGRNKPRYESSTIEKWTEALSRVSNICGLELEACNGDESVLIDKIEQWVEKKLRKNYFCSGLPYWFGCFAMGV